MTECQRVHAAEPGDCADWSTAADACPTSLLGFPRLHCSTHTPYIPVSTLSSAHLAIGPEQPARVCKIRGVLLLLRRSPASAWCSCIVCVAFHLQARLECTPAVVYVISLLDGQLSLVSGSWGEQVGKPSALRCSRTWHMAPVIVF